MKIPSLFTSLAFGTLAAFSPLATVADEPSQMLGNQSQNTGLPAIPAKQPPKIDGNLDDWDLSGRMWSFNDINLRDQYSVETAAMWDNDALYLALKWHDPTPLYNMVNPKTDPNDGWKSDSVQMRIQSDHILWVTAWHYTAENTSNILIDRLKNPNNEREGKDTNTYFGKPGNPDLGDGIQMAFAKTGNDSYTQEIRIPWQVIYKQKPALKAGDKIRIGFEYFWGDSSGKNWPTCRYADNMQPGMTSREFFWRAKQAWGDVTLMDKGNLPLRQYKVAALSLDGPIKCKLEIPKQAKRFTAVIDDANGRRVRNLVADCQPADYATADTATGVTVTVPWDGKNDAGEFVAPGSYRVRGLWHEGLDAFYDFTFYNPGTPSWPTADGHGSWGSNHCKPEFVAAAGDWMIVGWQQSEGGSALIGINPEGLKNWGELRGANPLAADKDSVYSCIKAAGTEELNGAKLFRLDAKTGAYKPFQIDGKDRTFPLPLNEIFGERVAPSVTAMAAHDGKLAMGFEDGYLTILDGNSAKILAQHPLGKKVTSLAYSSKGGLYAVVNGAVVKVDAEGKLSPVKTPGLKDAGSLAVDLNGNVLVYDRGADQQVKAFSPKGKLVYTAGKKGGRPIRGKYEPQAMAEVTEIAVDSKGNIWAAEHTNYPRRVSVWGNDGKLVRDYVGNTGYAGVGCTLNENDDSLAYVGPIELKRDPATQTFKVSQIIWKADESRADEPKSFDVDPQENALPRRFRSSAGGKEREFMFVQPNYYWAKPSVLFMQGDKSWRPVSAVGLVGQISGEIAPKGNSVVREPDGDYAGLSAWDGFVWNDKNGDGRVQRDECEIIPAEPSKKKGERPKTTPIPLGNSWNNGINTKDLSFLVHGLYRYTPLRFTPEGAPVYGKDGIRQITKVGPELLSVDVPDENLVLSILTSGLVKPQTIAMAGIDNAKGDILWTYPNIYPGVHGSHKAPMARPGLIIGPLKIMGVAKVNPTVGNVFAIRGNLGQDYFFTTDGLNIGALFRDCRYPNHSLPETEAEVKGASMAGYSEGGEPFSGWFGSFSDQKIRIMTSIGRTAGLAVQVKGLETIHRFQGSGIELTAEKLQEIVASAKPEVAPEAEAPHVYKIAKVTEPLPITGNAAPWSKIASVEIAKEGSPEKASAQLAYDDKTLYIRFKVTDASPLLNSGNDFRRLFKTGDAVDLQIGPGIASHKEPVDGDVRLMLSTLNGKPVAVLLRPKDATAPASLAETYTSPVGPRKFDRVEKLDGVQMNATKVGGGYTFTAAVPLANLGIQPTAGLKLRGDLGFISSDDKGLINIARTYWANSATGLVNDEPQEAWIYPATWGDFILE